MRSLRLFLFTEIETGSSTFDGVRPTCPGQYKTFVHVRKLAESPEPPATHEISIISTTTPTSRVRDTVNKSRIRRDVFFFLLSFQGRRHPASLGRSKIRGTYTDGIRDWGRRYGRTGLGPAPCSRGRTVCRPQRPRSPVPRNCWR